MSEITLESLKSQWHDRNLTDLSEAEVDSFVQQIQSVKSDWMLADWRYDIGFSKDPNQSHWMTRYINRELTRRKQDRAERAIRQRYAITTAIALGSLVIALAVALKPDPPVEPTSECRGSTTTNPSQPATQRTTPRQPGAAQKVE